MLYTKFLRAVLAIPVVLVCACSHRAPEPPPEPPKETVAIKSLQDLDAGQLRDELRRILEEAARQGPTGSTGATKGTRPAAPSGRVQDILSQIRERLQAELRRAAEGQWGPLPGLQAESVSLEALDSRGRMIEVPFTFEARPLRSLTDAANTAKTRMFLQPGGLPLSMYDDLPPVVPPVEREPFRRVYSGEAANAIAMEAKLIVTMKGGEWVTPDGNKRVANAVAFRGLDFDRGLLSNTNKTYDDTMYIVIEARGVDSEVYEYRMTTESSSANKGVGRLNSMQVTYVRGLHRGQDPGYRLKGNAAEGTRAGLEGSYQIVGANIHSAYARRTIDSATPLKANVSLGCQVVAAGKQPFEQSLVFLLDKKGVKEFPYTIVDDTELAFFDQTLRDSQRESVIIHRIPHSS